MAMPEMTIGGVNLCKGKGCAAVPDSGTSLWTVPEPLWDDFLDLVLANSGCASVCMYVCVCVCVCTAVRSFVRSFVRLFVCSFVRLFVCSFVCCWQQRRPVLVLRRGFLCAVVIAEHNQR